MKEELEKVVKAFTIAEAIATGVVIVLGLIALLARAVYLAWK